MALRVALLSFQEPVQSGRQGPRAYLRLCGIALARHQLALALAAGSERVVCLAPVLDTELIALQHEAERAGVRFHMISGARALSGLVTANDQLLVFADGLFPSVVDALELVGQSPVVLTLPADSAVPLGFERIDINHASAGLMLLPGQMVERLNELPEDVEPISALLRLALQAGVPQKPVPPVALSDGRWAMVCDDNQAHAAELGWMERHTRGQGRSPGLAVVGLAVRQFGPALLHAGSGARSLALSSLALLLLSVVLGWFGWFTLAFLLCVPAWLVHRAARMIAKIQSDALGTRPDWLAAGAPFDVLLDTVLGSLALAATPYVYGELFWQRAFVPFVLFAVLELFPQALAGRWDSLLRDRMLLALGLAAMAAGGVLQFGIPLFIVCLLLAGILALRGSYRLTRP